MEVFKVINLMTDKILASPVYCASTYYQRMKGLLGRTSMEGIEGLYIPRCRSIHTFFMKFSIDIVFMDKTHKVQKIINCLKPFRLASGTLGSFGVLELPCHTIDLQACRPGDQLFFEKMESMS
jgi:uncharacterized protein